MADRFPKDCWDKHCPYFHVWDMSVDDLCCACDLLEKTVDACDQEWSVYLCPQPLRIRWNGYEVISDKNCVEKVQARRHKKRRINKKWLKRYGMKYVPSRKIYVIHSNGWILGHPIVMDKLIEKIKAEEEADDRH